MLVLYMGRFYARTLTLRKTFPCELYYAQQFSVSEALGRLGENPFTPLRSTWYVRKLCFTRWVSLWNNNIHFIFNYLFIYHLPLLFLLVSHFIFVFIKVACIILYFVIRKKKQNYMVHEEILHKNFDLA